MTTASTTLLGLALPVTGELSGTWGDVVNASLTNLLDTAIAGTTTLSSDADVTLTTTTLSANQARQAVILWTAGGTVTRTITAPAQSKPYIVINKTSSSQSIKIVGVGPTTGVTIVAGTAALVVWNGVDFVTASVTSTTGIVPVANGGTGLASGTSGGVLAYTATGTLASSAALAASALVLGGGAGAAPATTTTGTGVVTALGVNTGSAGAPVLFNGALGTPSSGTVTNLTGTASININGTVGATTPATGNFTTLTENSVATVIQTDIGTGANEIPLNQYLGKLAYEDTVGLLATLNPAPTIASAATIQPLAPITFISGTTTINTITAPAEFVGGGQITLIPTGLWSTGTSGNIAIATTGVVSKALILSYDATTTKWYPSY